MITSFRRADCDPLSPETGVRGGAGRLLSVTDGDTVEVLHLSPAGATDAQEVPHGRLLIVVAGSGAVTIGAHRYEVRAGDVARVPRDLPAALETGEGLSVVVVTYPEARGAWRVSVREPQGVRWAVGVLSDTARARALRDQLRAAGWDVTLE